MKKLIATVLAGLVLASSFGSVKTYAVIKDKKVIQYIDKMTKGEAKKTNYWYDKEKELNIFPMDNYLGQYFTEVKTFKIAKNFWNGNYNLQKYSSGIIREAVGGKGKLAYGALATKQGQKKYKGWARLATPISAYDNVTTKVKVKNSSIAEVKVVDDLGDLELHIFVKPKNVGKTKVSVTYSKEGYKDYTFTTTVEVTKDGWWADDAYRTYISKNGSIGEYQPPWKEDKDYKKNFEKMMQEVYEMKAETEFEVIENIAKWIYLNIDNDNSLVDDYNYGDGSAVWEDVGLILKTRKTAYWGYSNLFREAMKYLGVPCIDAFKLENYINYQWCYFTYKGEIYEADPWEGVIHKESQRKPY